MLRKNILLFFRLANKARFILMVVNEELELRNRPKKDICQELHEHEFTMFFKPPMGKRKHGKTSLDDEDEENNSEPLELEDKIMVGFNYLLRMSLASLTKEKVFFFLYSCLLYNLTIGFQFIVLQNVVVTIRA